MINPANTNAAARSPKAHPRRQFLRSQFCPRFAPLKDRQTPPKHPPRHAQMIKPNGKMNSSLSSLRGRPLAEAVIVIKPRPEERSSISAELLSAGIVRVEGRFPRTVASVTGRSLRSAKSVLSSASRRTVKVAVPKPYPATFFGDAVILRSLSFATTGRTIWPIATTWRHDFRSPGLPLTIERR